MTIISTASTSTPRLNINPTVIKPDRWDSATGNKVDLVNQFKCQNTTSNISGFARTLTGKSSGKYYFEISWENATAGTGTVGCGLVKSTVSVEAEPSGSADFWGVWGRNQGARHNGTNTISFASDASERWGFAVDLDAGELWIWDGNANAWLQGDPETGTSPIWSNLSGYTLHPMAEPWTPNVSLTIHSSYKSLARAVPDGFVAGWPVDIVTDGLLVHLDAANAGSYPGTGTTVFDMSPSRYDGTINGGIVHSSDVNGIFTFDGVVGSYIDLGAAESIGSSLTGLTVEVFVKPLAAELCLMLENGPSFTTNTFYLAQENATEFSFEVYGDASYHAVFQEYTVGEWQQLVGTWESNVDVDLYINGAPGDSRRYQGTQRASVRDGTTNLLVGARPTTPDTLNMNSSMAIVRIYDRALTPAEISRNFEAQRRRFGI